MDGATAPKRFAKAFVEGAESGWPSKDFGSRARSLIEAARQTGKKAGVMSGPSQSRVLDGVSISLFRSTEADDEDITGLLAYAIYKRDKTGGGARGYDRPRVLETSTISYSPLGLIDQYRDGAFSGRLENLQFPTSWPRAEPEIREAARVEAVERAERRPFIAVVKTSTTWWISILWKRPWLG